MARNTMATSCAKHKNIRYKYVNEYVEDTIVKIVSVKSSGTDSNIIKKK